MSDDAVSYIIERILAGERKLSKIKSKAAKLYKLKAITRNSDILQAFPKDKLTKEIKLLLTRKPMRTLSGVTPIAVMIKPEGSCKWSCIYCPFTGKAAKSYTGEEPAALRARDNDFDPLKQVKSRLKQFEIGGHPTDKCEVIVMGGTFLAMDGQYKNYFIKSIYEALNGKKARDIEEAKKTNEKAKNRMVGLTIETRPDVCGRKEINEILEFGTTKVELGVQHPDDKIYTITNRGHKTKEVTDVTGMLKDSCFKVLYHIMPGLPGSDPKKDVGMIRRIFTEDCFKPDMLKIYPTLVMPKTQLFNMTQRGEYEPYDSELAAEVISEFYRYIPKYVRVMRIQRDIPATRISRGVKKSNLREMVERKIMEKGIKVNEIRFREVGLRKMKLDKSFDIERLNYNASGGKEIFLSYENNELIAGFIRLRIPNGNIIRKEIDKNTGLIRELHVFGAEVPLEIEGGIQHRGIGSKLLSEAEDIAKEEFGMNKISIISGVGVRPYYYKRGYALEGPYVIKHL